MPPFQVIEEDRLQENSRKVGEVFLRELLKLREEFEVVGDVRGKGLMLGVEFVKNKVQCLLCVSACVSACVYVCVLVSACVCACVCACVHVYVLVCMCICAYVHVCVHVYVCMCVCLCMCACECVTID